jgi:hypothetical protein
MFIHVLFVDAVKMPVVQIIDVSFVLNHGVTAAGPVRMRMQIVRFVVAHCGYLL